MADIDGSPQKLVKNMVAVCLIGALIIGGSIQYYNYKNAGYAVKYQGKVLGYVRDKNAASEAFKSVKDDIKKLDPSISINDELEFEKAVVETNKLSDVSEMLKGIKDGLYKKNTYYCITINGSEIAVVPSEEEGKKVVEGVKNYFSEQEGKTGAQVLDVTIKDDIKVVSKVADTSKLSDAKTILDMLLAGKGKTIKYEVKSGDSLWRIAQDNNMTVEQIASINPGINLELLQIGQGINLAVSEPYLNVETTVKAQFDENIQYETNYEQDSNLYKGQQRVVKPGAYGINRIVKEIKKLNGKEIASKVLEANIIKQPVIRVMATGTKLLVGSGQFLWPLNGSISSGFGSRGWEYHKGLDIAAPIGTPIAASDGGTVIQSGRYYDYGNLVIIDHGNGYTTYYAHCSTLYVKEGETVKRGQTIAAVGMTGWTTGPHVHFEIRKGGSYQNPLNYLD